MEDGGCVNSLADDGVLGHDGHVSASKDVTAAGGGDEDVAAVGDVLHGGDLVAGHGGLEGVDGVDLGDDDASTVRGERLGTL